MSFLRIPRRSLALVVIAIVANVVLFQLTLSGTTTQDFPFFVDLGHRAWAGLPLYPSGAYHWSPLLAYAFVLLPGYAVWSLLHVVAAVAMPRPLGLVVLVSFPFWNDVAQGNVLTFLVLIAAWALRGQGWAIGATFVAAMLIPRPLMAPLVVWLLWKHPEWRLRFVGLALVIGAATLATGHAFEWLGASGVATSDIGHPWNLSPSRIIGVAWIPLGLALSVVLLRAGYVGLACLAASPYLLPYYLLFGLLDLQVLDHLNVKKLAASRRAVGRGPAVEVVVG